MRWLFPSVNFESAKRLAEALSLPPKTAQILIQRGLGDAQAAARFLQPELSDFHDPFLMAGMPAAVARLRRAVEAREKILIYGDYDVDGTMAVVVLKTALGSLGADVSVHIPHRITDGYGMRANVLERAATEGCRVVVSVDTGIREHEALQRARDLGLDCIVTDHHLPGPDLPPAYAILDPRRPDCAYPDKNLSGAGVALKLAQGLLGEKFSAPLLRSYLKVVAIGTIADVVPLVGENRVIVRHGLGALKEPSQPGLTALLRVADLDPARGITTGQVAFRIAPRLNAAGRMQDAGDVIELLTTPDAKTAARLAERLDLLNRQRQSVQDEILDDIVARVESAPALLAGRYSLVFAAEGWHRGVIGIVAQKVAERYYRPTLVIGLENGSAHGSGRSIPGFHLLDALTEAGGLFERYGGHAQAAGFSLPADRVAELERLFEESSRRRLRPEDLEPVLSVDAEVGLAELDAAFLQSLAKFEPYGVGNPKPVFAARGLRVVDGPRFLKEKHLKLRVSADGRALDALGWNWAGRLPEVRRNDTLYMAFQLDEDHFQGASSWRLTIKDLRVV